MDRKTAARTIRMATATFLKSIPLSQSLRSDLHQVWQAAHDEQFDGFNDEWFGAIVRYAVTVRTDAKDFADDPEAVEYEALDILEAMEYEFEKMSASSNA